MNKKTVVVGMSGGVDSSVTALLLKQQGYEVIGLFMKNWEETDDQGVCLASKDFEDVVKVCHLLEIPYYSVSFAEDYQREVFSYFLESLKKGDTPNPDILCNREIKFKKLLERALLLGADYLATGHYAQIHASQEEYYLLKGKDPGKDQSYFLSTLTSAHLEKVLFPVGGLDKEEVRRIAAAHQLSTAAKKDSTGICFIGKRDFKNFVGGYLPYNQGQFENLQGKVIGKHDGCAFYTIGQRKGLNIGGPGEAWFVVGKDIARNVVFIEQGADHPALYSEALIASELSWVSPQGAPSFPFKCHAKVRYRQPDQECVIEKIEEDQAGDRAFVTFTCPQRAVTPGQAIVFYDGVRCLGGGVIQKTGPSLHNGGGKVL